MVDFGSNGARLRQSARTGRSRRPVPIDRDQEGEGDRDGSAWDGFAVNVPVAAEAVGKNEEALLGELDGVDDLREPGAEIGVGYNFK
jgi:hypothetical protein